ncbi:TonB-dependent receptor domain-containing protein [Phocoenobacter skyensis]|uniref:Hemoglobin/transferrin/lactoferrin receptor protein n=1 Tax=Phocoenobacter skyensis TaxID=97481 RepID=A0A1H7YAG2_9PAST|nr:TonB-dependent receptor [Pasteurella skyensis]MDP8078802.1 TonB-dependent receptor [Pasteurella skyensis]MDP8085872.1 TonB-dependent receptor [Pasteurella skyensis]MDP8186013.1 TonB-dependent receptor [Pasteurella skyensis]QLB22722.1 TonB-dependent receptor [Pasteurella skyensis]SEM42308.1 hemoglobin/transferrin/lactoferrin receptor protein [Pasteurella skyensis]
MKNKVCLNLISTALIVVSSSAQAVDLLDSQLSTLGTITVTDKAESIDEQKKDEVYLRDITNMYADKETVERYKGAAPADLFQEFNGVYSGDARNSGAVDPNIRGIQGQGRIPVTVDGTEQALTTWRGYNGANNRNYLDPNLIAGITVEKGPAIASGNQSGIGGAVKMRTIDADDIVKEGNKFGAEVIVETSDNSVKERIPDFSWGKDYRKHGTPDVFGDFSSVTLVEPKEKGKWFKDNAMRIALGLKEDKFDLLGAYSYRSKGNYLAGKGGAHKYEGVIDPKSGRELKQIEPNLPFAASIYPPHTEIPNTSSVMESFLLKNTLRFTDKQKLKIGYRQTKINYGEVMPSRLDFSKFVGWIPQWPLAKVKQNAFNMDYSYNPDNHYINFKAGVWYTKTVSDTNTSGGNPREPGAKTRDEIDWDWFGQAMMCWRGYDPNVDPHHQIQYDPECMKRIGAEAIAKRPNTTGQYSYVNAAQVNAYNTRRGFNLSNIMHLTKNLDLTLSGAFQTERLTSSHFKELPNPSSTYESPPRVGHRQEWDLAFNFNYRPTDWLVLTAGGRYNEYWSYDDYLERLLKTGVLYHKVLGVEPKVATHLGLTFNEVLTKEELDKWNYIDKRQKELLGCSSPGSPTFTQACHDEYWATYTDKNKIEKGEYSTDSGSVDPKTGLRYHNGVDIPYRKDGRTHREDNPFYNGTIKNKLVRNPATGKMEHKYQGGRIHEGYEKLQDKDKLTRVGKQRGHAFSPSFSATAFLSDNARAYLRYIQYARMPSIFETTIGFSASADTVALYPDAKLKPEKAQNIEIGYVHNFGNYFDTPVKADLKLSYYHNVTKNVIDRNTEFRFVQLEKRTLEGLELQARYDNGDYFGDLGVEYHLKNKVCDPDSAVRLDPIALRVPHCITGGFAWGYLRTQLQPKYSISANIGGRFFDRKLELGTRWLYHSKAKNKDEDRLWEQKILNEGIWNRPMSWQPVLTLDAYAKYQVNKNLSVEFTGTNLTDRYYLDPMTRSMIPAPGRTFKLGLKARF